MTKDSEKTTVDTLLETTKRDLKIYGQDVVEQRAVPDYRDGLKPVHRFILWACYGLGLKYGTPFKKAARTVGETIGKFSPHGDQATYDAMVLMAGVRSEDGKSWTSKNSNVPLIEGYGNWGDNVDNAAAMRYTEARLSEFSTKYLLDPIYLAVSDYIPNFSGDDRVPLVLPARLPIMMLNGSTSIAFGVSAECPSFAPAGVVELVKRCLSGEEITPKLCTQVLEFAPTFGGKCVSDRKLILPFHKNGYGSLQFMPDMEYDEKQIKKDVVTNFIGKELYEISMNQLIRYFREYRNMPIPDIESSMKEFIRCALGSQIAAKLNDQDLDYLIEKDSLFSVDDIIRKIDITKLLPEIKRFALEERIPTFSNIEPMPIVIGFSVFFVDAEVIKLLDHVKAIMITEEFSLEKRNAKLGE
jgi:DNA gyrase/topoisomerase IV subunit A